MSNSDITFAPPSAGQDTGSGSHNSGEVQIGTVAHPAAPATTNGQGDNNTAADDEDGTLTTTIVRRKSRSPSSASRAGAQSKRDAASLSKRSASSGSRRSACNPRVASGRDSDNSRRSACIPRDAPGRDSTVVPVSPAQDDPDLMLEASIQAHLLEVGRAGSERSLRDASDRSIKSQTSSRASKRFTPLADILQHGQAEPNSPRKDQVAEHFNIVTPPEEQPVTPSPLPPPNSSPPFSGSLIDVVYTQPVGSPFTFGPNEASSTACNPRVAPAEASKRSDADRLAKEKDKRHKAEQKALTEPPVSLKKRKKSMGLTLTLRIASLKHTTTKDSRSKSYRCKSKLSEMTLNVSVLSMRK